MSKIDMVASKLGEYLHILKYKIGKFDLRYLLLAAIFIVGVVVGGLLF